MKVYLEEGPLTPDVCIDLTGAEVAQAIEAWLVAHGVVVRGPRRIDVNGGLCECGNVYVGPSGFVIYNGEKFGGI